MGMKAKEPVGVSAQGEVNLTDDELIALHRNCILNTADASCLGCPYRKTTYTCDSNKLNRQIVDLIKRQKKRIAELEEENAVKRWWAKATMEQAEADELFNGGRFNDIAIGYAKLALRTMGEKSEKIEHFEKVMKSMLDTFDAEAARTAHFKN